MATNAKKAAPQHQAPPPNNVKTKENFAADSIAFKGHVLRVQIRQWAAGLGRFFTFDTTIKLKKKIGEGGECFVMRYEYLITWSAPEAWLDFFSLRCGLVFVAGRLPARADRFYILILFIFFILFCTL